MTNVTGVRRVVRQFLKLNTWGEDIMRLKKRVGSVVVEQAEVNEELESILKTFELIDQAFKQQNDVILDLADGMKEIALYLQQQAAEKESEDEETTYPDESCGCADGL